MKIIITCLYENDIHYVKPEKKNMEIFFSPEITNIPCMYAEDSLTSQTVHYSDHHFLPSLFGCGSMSIGCFFMLQRLTTNHNDKTLHVSAASKIVYRIQFVLRLRGHILILNFNETLLCCFMCHILS